MTRPRTVWPMPSVSSGSLFRRKGTQNWFIKFYLDGKAKRETTGTPDRDEALEFLRQRIDEASRGRFTERAYRIDSEVGIP